MTGEVSWWRSLVQSLGPHRKRLLVPKRYIIEVRGPGLIPAQGIGTCDDVIRAFGRCISERGPDDMIHVTFELEKETP